jgi:hypothetical protein
MPAATTFWACEARDQAKRESLTANTIDRCRGGLGGEPGTGPGEAPSGLVALLRNPGWLIKKGKG